MEKQTCTGPNLKKEEDADDDDDEEGKKVDAEEDDNEVDDAEEVDEDNEVDDAEEEVADAAEVVEEIELAADVEESDNDEEREHDGKSIPKMSNTLNLGLPRKCIPEFHENLPIFAFGENDKMLFCANPWCGCCVFVEKSEEDIIFIQSSVRSVGE